MRKKWSGWMWAVTIAAALAASAGQVQAQEQQRTQQPLRVGKEAVPAKIAFTNQGHLWLLDGRDSGALPMQLTTDGVSEIVGWSADGKWLLYVKHSGEDTYATPGYLWAVRENGTGAFQVDDRPVMDQPKWSPVARQVAYFVNTGSVDNPKQLFLVKELQDSQAKEVLSTAPDFVDFSWMPDGKQLLVSTAAERNRAMTLSLRDLSGKQAASYPIAAPPNVDEGIYAWAPRAMAVSPDGAHVGYYVQYNSGSLSADGVPIQLFDLSHPKKKPTELGTGLINPDWLTWSPDGKKLAFIEGTDRMATSGKHLKLADPSGKVISISQPDMVDGAPAWTRSAPYSLFFTRGKGTEYHYDPKKVMVPGQRIWQQAGDAAAKPVTQGSESTADYFPHPSPAGDEVLFVRLDTPERGSLFLSAQGKESEVLRHVTGEIGFYANYTPQWISVYWEGKPQPQP